MIIPLLFKCVIAAALLSEVFLGLAFALRYRWNFWDQYFFHPTELIAGLTLPVLIAFIAFLADRAVNKT